MPLQSETFTVEHSRPGVRLDIFLREKFPTTSRGAMQRLIDEGHVRVNGKTVKPTHAPREVAGNFSRRKMSSRTPGRECSTVNVSDGRGISVMRDA